MITRDALASLEQDLRWAVRALGRTPGFTIVATASLAIGLALTAVTAAAVDAYLIEPLPYAEAERLYRVRYAPPGPWEPRGMSSLDWESVADVVEFPITSTTVTFYLADGGFAQSARGLRVGRGFVEGLGLVAAFGRTLGDIDFAGTAHERSALIGYALWQERYGSDPNILGRTLRVDVEGGRGTSETLRIVGVLPRAFYFGRDSRERVDLLVPLPSPARTYMVRLQPGVPAAFAEERITAAARQVASELPADWTGVELNSVRETYVAEVRPILLGVVVACGLVLLIVCANVAVLMLLRTMRRQKELAVRAALGGSRWHLARMLLIEAGLVCAAAAASAIVLTTLALDALAPVIERELGRPAPGGSTTIAIDTTVLLVVAAAGVAVALAISFLPLLAPWQGRMGDVLRRETPGSAGAPSIRRVRSLVMALEVAGTLVLLVGCGLMVRSVIGMVRTDLGFEPDRLVRARIVLRGSDYADAAAFSRFYRQFTERLTAAINAPAVFTNWPPFVERPVRVVESADRDQGMNAGVIAVSAGYFATMGIELRSGRDFAMTDASGSEPVAVISETLARRLWPEGASPGRRVRIIEQTPDGPSAGPWRTIVGVAADVRQAYGDSELSDIYTPRIPEGRFGTFYIRSDRPPSALLPEIRSIAAEIDPHAIVDPPREVESENRQLAGTRFLAVMLGAFAAVAAFLAVLGIYGVTAYAVQQRERETAIRMALGATSRVVVRMFVVETAVILIVGLSVGLLAAGAASRILESQLFGVRRFDVPTLAVTCLVLAAAGVLAAWWPARRASRRQPFAVLKDA